jgi:hypothetical protein
VRHVQSIYLWHRKASELRCESCFSRAKSFQTYAMIAAVGFAVVTLVVLFVVKFAT